jgi:SAM-dependent methyltransferase
MSKEWFVDWFNSPYYHILYKNRDDKEARSFIKNLSRTLKFQAEDHILDLACGKGRHSIYLNKKGFHVTGLDLSRENIAFAKQFENDRLHFDVHDMREPYPARFNFILNLFTSFGYFESTADNRKVLESVNKMLVPKGRVVIDFFNAGLVLNELIPSETKIIDGIGFHIRKEYTAHKIIKTINFKDMGKEFEFREQVQALTLDDFRKLFAETGFEIIYTFGDYNLNPFRENHSPRLILIAQHTNV